MTNPIKIISKTEFEKKNKKPNQEKVWDSIGNPWKNIDSMEVFVIKRIPIVVEFLNGKKGLVVDLGCGNGRNMIKRALLKKDLGEKSEDIEYSGVDFSSGQLSHAEKYIKNEGINAKLFKSDIDKLDKSVFKDEMFDYGLFMASIHCLDSSEKRLNALKEFYRILKKNSQALISVWNSEDKRFDKIKNKGDVYMSWKEDEKEHMRYYYLYSKYEFIYLLEKVGFKILEFYSSGKDRFSKKNWIVRVGK